MSQRTTAGHPADSHRTSETLSTPCPSEGSKAVRQTGSKADNNFHSSRSVALAFIVETLRPEWSTEAIAKALAADDRPWRTVVLASIRGAAGTDVRHPNGLRYVNPDGVGGATPLPPTVRELRTAPTCQHGAPSGLCALCRNGIDP